MLADEDHAKKRFIYIKILAVNFDVKYGVMNIKRILGDDWYVANQ